MRQNDLYLRKTKTYSEKQNNYDDERTVEHLLWKSSEYSLNATWMLWKNHLKGIECYLRYDSLSDSGSIALLPSWLN